jgi:hypothetical protein
LVTGHGVATTRCLDQLRDLTPRTGSFHNWFHQRPKEFSYFGSQYG